MQVQASNDGTVTIPEDIMRRVGANPGDNLAVEVAAGTQITIRLIPKKSD